ncbi:MAG: hypothetical protein ACOC0U_00410 [Desulfovibrionales bacterium]
MNPQSRIGVLVAFGLEAFHLAGRYGWKRRNGLMTKVRSSGGREWIWCIAGTGSDNAAAAARKLLQMGAGAILNPGTSGGLDPGIKGGELVLADRIVDSSGRVWQSPTGFFQWSKRLVTRYGSVHQGGILCASAAVLDPIEKARIFQESGLLAVDTESGGAARESAERDVPFLALRAICDTAEEKVAVECLEILSRDGRIDFSRLWNALMHRPVLILDLIRMQRRFSRAIRELGRGVHMLVEKDVQGEAEWK